MSSVIKAIRPRRKPDEPARTQHVDCPYPSQWGPGYDQSRVNTFDYVAYQWNSGPWTTTGGQCQPVPPKPEESQHVPCPYPDTYGPGYEQTRVCTFNYSTGVWECTGWQTVSGQCTAVPPRPSESQHVDCPYPEQYGPGYDQTRSCTFNYSSGQWECTGWTTVGGSCTNVPPKPAEAQTIPCPTGFVGSGQNQTRTCNFNYQTGAWECTPWNTVSQDCVPEDFNLLTIQQAWSPRTPTEAQGAFQTWISNQQDPVENNPNYTFGVSARIERTGQPGSSTEYTMTVSITVTGPGTANKFVMFKGGHVGGSDVFNSKNLDAQGKASWTISTVGFIANDDTQWRVYTKE